MTWFYNKTKMGLSVPLPSGAALVAPKGKVEITAADEMTAGVQFLKQRQMLVPLSTEAPAEVPAVTPVPVPPPTPAPTPAPAPVAPEVVPVEEISTSAATAPVVAEPPPPPVVAEEQPIPTTAEPAPAEPPPTEPPPVPSWRRRRRG